MRPAAKGTYVRAAILCPGSIPRAKTAQFPQIIIMIIARLNFRARLFVRLLRFRRFIARRESQPAAAAAGAVSADIANTVANLANQRHLHIPLLPPVR